MKTKTAARAPKTFDIEGLSTCTACGCTDIKACQGGCTWIKLDREKGTGLCSKCFKGKLPRTKHKPDNRCIYISDRARKNIEFVQAVEPLLNWGVQRLFDMSGVEIPPVKNGKEAHGQARQRLKDIQKRLRKEIRQADPDGGPDRRDAN